MVCALILNDLKIFVIFTYLSGRKEILRNAGKIFPLAVIKLSLLQIANDKESPMLRKLSVKS